MKCLLCTGDLILDDPQSAIQEFDTYALVTRKCTHCHQVWILKHVGRQMISMTEEGATDQEFGFDYTCPHCKFQSYVATTFRPKTGWNCFGCGEKVPNECCIPRGGYELPEIVYVRSTGKTSRRRQNASTYQRTPRTSKPLPAGSIGISELSESLNVEGKKLRSWLRKVGWRKSEEAGSGWSFSAEEAEEVKKNFGR